MAEVSFTNAAEADLMEIDEFSVAHFGEHAGETYMRGFTEAFSQIAQHPQSGRASESYGAGVRCLIHKRHRIFYRIENDGVLVLRILHQARDARSRLEDDGSWGT